MKEEQRKYELKNYDYEFYFLIVLVILGGLLYLQVKSIFFAEKEPQVESQQKGMTVAEEMAMMNRQFQVTNKLPETSETTVVKQPTYIIDGIDFYPYNIGEEGLQEVMDRMHYDSLRVLVTTFYNGAVDILADGNLYTMKKERGSYIYYIVFPKDPESIVIKSDCITLNHITSNGKYGNYNIYSFYMNNIVGENLEVPINVTYIDGTIETLTLYITKKY